jgi:hypothetical protein
MRLWFSGLATCLVLVGGSSRADEKWQTFTSKEGRFSVSLPGKPMEKTEQVSAPGGTKKELHTFTLASASDQIYHLNYNDYPKEVVKEDKNKEAAFDTLRKAFGGKVLSEKKITVGKNKAPGRELLIELPKKNFYRARVFFIGNRLFQVVAMGSEEFARGKKADQFLDSFKAED